MGTGVFNGSESVSIYGPIEDCLVKQYAEENWIPYNQFTLTYHDNDSQLYSLQLTAGELLPDPYYLTKDGYVFCGWYKDFECTYGQQWNFRQDIFTEDTNLYAKWKNADFNEDAIVDMLDLIELAQKYNKSYDIYDIREDGIINIFDLVVLAEVVTQ